ncbi:MAG: GHKL domain-containing protein [Proteobacteria bacterium]|nr:GHKL domain-containing protein [Pseudomonadota bacterium]MBU4297981.1 GHKL domain-containing protein [Pseudomonadota bacterium]MCG2749541.1 ATP-binding protein [Desulfobulbaceae bacterium]
MTPPLPESADAGQHQSTDPTPLGPSWKINLLVIGGLIFIVLAYSLWQIGQLRRNFQSYAREHSRVVSSVIEQNTRTVRLAENALQQTIKTFLANTAKFIDYLESVEPFSAAELQAFAGETGLSAISIQRDGSDKNTVSSGAALLPTLSCDKAVLDYIPGKNLYVMTWPRPEKGCIILGFSAQNIEELHQQLRMPALLKALSAMPGIKYVKIEEKATEASPPQAGMIVEQHISAGDTALRVGFDASQYSMRVRQIWRNVLIFSLVLACLGVFFSWLLYRYQSAYLQKITDFERKLAREREDAALGRATATITHEIRNPLNAISMGLQRIELEADELSPEHRELAASMRHAVKRTNTIIGDLLRYSRSMAARLNPVNLTQLIDGILQLYKPQYEAKNISVSHNSNLPDSVQGDGELLGQLFENIIKNAVEAQPGGGYISVTSHIENNQARITIENAMPRGSVDNLNQLLEPYFTTKTRGTGLGLPIARRIAQAHNGTLTLATPSEDVFRAIITLPLTT